jgi:hypothetical protein
MSLRYDNNDLAPVADVKFASASLFIAQNDFSTGRDKVFGDD